MERAALTDGPTEAIAYLKAISPESIDIHEHIGDSWYGDTLDRDATLTAFTHQITERIHQQWPNVDVRVTFDRNVDAAPSIRVAGTSSTDAIKVRHAVEHYLAVMMTSPRFLIWADAS